MPRLATPLTDTQVKTAKPRDKTYTLADGGGMYLEVAPTGSKIWRMAYRHPIASLRQQQHDCVGIARFPDAPMAEIRFRGW